MAHSVRSHLGLDVDAYDAAIRQFIPGYDTMLSAAAGPAAAVLPELVVDLGAGTGALAEALLERRGVGRVRLLDIDPEMLDQARERLAPFGDRASFEVGSFDDSIVDADAVVASLALHHLPTIEEKQEVFARIFDALRPGGVFVNADATMPDDPMEREELYRFWIDHMASRGIDAERAEQHLEEWSEEDTYLPLQAEVGAMSRVGFDARCVWQAGPITVVVARKPLID